MPTKEIAPGVLAVTGLPEDAQSFSIDKADGYLYYIFSRNGFADVNQIILPPGSWKVLGWSDELTEEQCESIDEYGEFNGRFYRHAPEGAFRPASFGAVFTCNSRVESFQSLLRTHNIEKALIIVNNHP